MLHKNETRYRTLDDQKEPTIKISIYTHKQKCCSHTACDFMICSHCTSHSSALIEHIPTKEDYYVSFGGDDSYRNKRERLQNSIDTGYYKDHKPIILIAYENDAKTFKKFKIDYSARFHDSSEWCVCSNNCSDATAFTIAYFPRQPVYHEPLGELFLRWGSKILCGVFGSGLGIRACSTIPGMTTPAEVEKYTRKIEREQQRFFAVKATAPEQQKMEDSMLSPNFPKK